MIFSLKNRQLGSESDKAYFRLLNRQNWCALHSHCVTWRSWLLSWGIQELYMTAQLLTIIFILPGTACAESSMEILPPPPFFFTSVLNADGLGKCMWTVCTLLENAWMVGDSGRPCSSSLSSWNTNKSFVLIWKFHFQHGLCGFFLVLYQFFFGNEKEEALLFFFLKRTYPMPFL